MLNPITKYVQDKLAKAGTSVSNDAIIGKIPGWLDYKKVDEWVSEYIALMKP